MIVGFDVILLIVMAVVLLLWVIFCAISFIRHSRDVMVSKDFIAHVQCEKCGMHYDVSASDFSKSFVSKYKSVTRTKVEKGALINRPHYSYYAKKLYCPKCKKKRYAQVLNVNELNYMMEKPMLQSGLRWLLIMVIGGAIILAIAAIPMHFSNQAREQRVEELKEKQQEIIKERYGF